MASGRANLGLKRPRVAAGDFRKALEVELGESLINNQPDGSNRPGR
jgi:hypothetical protein